MTMHILGSGNGGALKIYNTCFCIENDGKFLLVDGGGGNGVLLQIERAGIEFSKIKDVFLSHNHIDHIMGIPWVMRQIYIMRRDGKYDGECNIYAGREGVVALKAMHKIVFANTDYDTFKGINYVEIFDGREIEICGMRTKFFDILAHKDKQFGFTINDNHVVFAGDEPLRAAHFPKFKNCNWLLHEAFCLDTDKEIYKPHPKGHCTVKEAADTARELNAQNLVILHTKDNKNCAAYKTEARTNFNGNVFVPNDLDKINLKAGGK